MYGSLNLPYLKEKNFKEPPILNNCLIGTYRMIKFKKEDKKK